MKKKANKSGLSRIAINFIIILLIVIIGGVIFILVRNIMSNQGEQDVFDDSTLDLKISQVQKVNDNTLDVTVKRNEGMGEFVALSFAVDDGALMEIVRINSSMPENQDGNFSLNFVLLNASKIKRISVTPIFIDKNGKEVIGNVKDEYVTPNVCSTYCPSGAQCGFNDCGIKCGNGCSNGYLCLNYKCIKEQSSGGGGGSGSSSSSTTTCTDTCASLVKQCGTHTICGESVNCGTCSIGYVCNLGLCIEESTCTDTCSSLGHNCGTVCGVNCGTCSTGYSCIANGTCMKESTDCGEVTCKSGEYCSNGICLLAVSGNTYFVATNGNDNNPGTYSQPWRTWEKAFIIANSGDIVYIREGVYPATSTDGGMWVYNSGTSSNPIRFFNYPGETPILDGSNIVNPYTGINYGIRVSGVSNIHFKGLTIRNFHERYADVLCSGINAENVANITFENIVVYNIGGIGIGIYDYYGSNYIKNCDAYNVADVLSWWPGQNGVGIQWGNTPNLYGDRVYHSKLYIEGCRVWNFSDNGFAGGSGGYIELKNCWAFDGGMLNGEGCGFKMGRAITDDTYTTIPLQRRIINCVSANNGNYGFSDNNRGFPSMNSQYINCFAYHNGYKDVGSDDAGPMGWGWYNLNYLGTIAAPNWITANSISYANEQHALDSNVHENYYFSDDEYPENHNSWNNPPGVTVNDYDFVSLDIMQLYSPREKDGSLPKNITFGHLRSDSDLIDKGVLTSSLIEIGNPFPLNYLGSAPDLGAFEFSSVSSSCIGSSTQSCLILNGIGSQSRTCNNGVLVFLGSLHCNKL